MVCYHLEFSLYAIFEHGCCSHISEIETVFFFCSLQETYEQKRNQHLAELQRKEDEMRQMFVVRVKEKEAELKEAEKEVRTACNTSLFFLFLMQCVVSISNSLHLFGLSL